MSILMQNFTSNIPINIGLNSLANNSTVASTANDNSGFLFIGADVQLKFTTGATPTSGGTLNVFILKSVDGGFTYDDSNPTTAEFLRSIEVTSTPSTSYNTSFFIETLPKFWKILVENKTGDALDATPANFDVKYEGKKIEII